MKFRLDKDRIVSGPEIYFVYLAGTFTDWEKRGISMSIDEET